MKGTKVLVYLVGLLTISLLVFGSVWNQSVGSTEPRLADTINGKNIHSDSYAREYLAKHNNFSDLKFEKISGSKEIKLIVSASQRDIKGIEKENKRYAIDLVGCDYNTKTCNLRVNGVLIPNLKKNMTSISVDKQTSIEVEDSVFDKCDLRYCDLRRDTYNELNVIISDK